MWPRVILLKQPQTMLCHKRNHQRLQDGILVCHCIRRRVQRAIAYMVSADAGPHHDSTTIPSVMFQDTALYEPLTPTSVEVVTIGEGQVKLILVGKQHLPPLLPAPSSMVVGPGKSISTMTPCQNGSFVRYPSEESDGSKSNR